MIGDKRKLNVEVIGTNISGWMCATAKKYQGVAELMYVKRFEKEGDPTKRRYGIICDSEQRRFCKDDSQCAIVWDAAMTKRGKELNISQDEINAALKECEMVEVVLTPQLDYMEKNLDSLEAEWGKKKLQVFGRKV